MPTKSEIQAQINYLQRIRDGINSQELRTSTMDGATAEAIRNAQAAKEAIYKLYGADPKTAQRLLSGMGNQINDAQMSVVMERLQQQMNQESSVSNTKTTRTITDRNRNGIDDAIDRKRGDRDGDGIKDKLEARLEDQINRITRTSNNNDVTRGDIDKLAKTLGKKNTAFLRDGITESDIARLDAIADKMESARKARLDMKKIVETKTQSPALVEKDEPKKDVAQKSPKDSIVKAKLPTSQENTKESASPQTFGLYSGYPSRTDAAQLAEAQQRVAGVQQMLSGLGYDVGPQGIDKKFGPNSLKAWTSFETDKQLLKNSKPASLEDGGKTVSSDTLQKLGESYLAKTKTELRVPVFEVAGKDTVLSPDYIKKLQASLNFNLDNKDIPLTGKMDVPTIKAVNQFIGKEGGLKDSTGKTVEFKPNDGRSATLLAEKLIATSNQTVALLTQPKQVPPVTITPSLYTVLEGKGEGTTLEEMQKYFVDNKIGLNEGESKALAAATFEKLNKVKEKDSNLAEKVTAAEFKENIAEYTKLKPNAKGEITTEQLRDAVATIGKSMKEMNVKSAATVAQNSQVVPQYIDGKRQTLDDSVRL